MKGLLDVNALKAEMVRSGYTQQNLAKELGISSRTFSTRLKTGDFGSKEMETMISTLNLKDPMSIFFANKIT